MELDPILRISVSRVMMATILLCGVVCSGTVMFVAYWPDLFFKLDIFRVILLSLCCSLPLFVLNLIPALLGTIEIDQKGKGTGDKDWLLGFGSVLASVMTGLCLYGAAAMAYFFQLTPRAGIVVASVVDLVVMVLIVYAAKQTLVARDSADQRK